MDGVTVTLVTFQEKQKTDIGIFCPVFTAKTTKMSSDQCILDIQGKNGHWFAFSYLNHQNLQFSKFDHNSIHANLSRSCSTLSSKRRLFIIFYL